MLHVVDCARVLMVVVLSAAIAAPCAAAQDKRVNPDAKALAEFQEEVAEYVELHKKLERTLPELPKEAPAERVDEHKRALARLIQEARKGKKAGDIFESDVRPVLRRLLHGVFSGADGKRLRSAVMDENPGPAVNLQVNAQYPSGVPRSNMPARVLQVLPPLPPELEYRFVGDQLILLDSHADIIVDILSGAVPR
jgi:hypothetical protein